MGSVRSVGSKGLQIYVGVGRLTRETVLGVAIHPKGNILSPNFLLLFFLELGTHMYDYVGSGQEAMYTARPNRNQFSGRDETNCVHCQG